MNYRLLIRYNTEGEREGGKKKKYRKTLLGSMLQLLITIGVPATPASPIMATSTFCRLLLCLVEARRQHSFSHSSDESLFAMVIFTRLFIPSPLLVLGWAD